MKIDPTRPYTTINGEVFQHKPKKKRDFQRSKVYKAEDEAFTELGMYKGDEPEFKTTDECKKWIKENVLPLLKDYGIKKVVVKDGRGRRRAGAFGDRMTITLPKWSRRRWVILHEMAHIPMPNDEGHGDMFCALYILLVRALLGGEYAEKLIEKFDEHGVRY